MLNNSRIWSRFCCHPGNKSTPQASSNGRPNAIKTGVSKEMKATVPSLRRRLAYQPLCLLITSLFCLSSKSAAQSPLAVSVTLDSSLQVQLEWTPHSDPALYTVQSIDSITHVWKPIAPAGQWPIAETQYTDTRPSFLPLQRYYRVLADPLPKPERARLIEFSRVDSLTLEEVEDWRDQFGISAFPINSGVTIFHVSYETIDAAGASTTASGGVAIPTDFDGPLPLLSYQHRQVTDRENVPSRFSFTTFESFLPLFIAAQGFVTAAPDYLGQGESPGPHPFLLSQAAITAVLDLLPATQFIAESEGVEGTNELYLMGYGQGGHATMATHQAIESDPESPWQMGASVAMAGPYDLSGLWLDHLLRDTEHPAPYLLSYLIVAYNDIYAFYQDPNEVFTLDFVNRILPRINGRTNLEGMDSLFLNRVPSSVLREPFLNALKADPDHPFRVALRENDVYDWAPAAPILLYHCDADETIPKTISEKTLDTFFDNGSNFGELIDPIPSLDHASCDGVSITSALIWLRNL